MKMMNNDIVLFETKAANLLYFMIKDHPYADGCKRIAASLFLEFLEKNNALFRNGQKTGSYLWCADRSGDGCRPKNRGKGDLADGEADPGSLPRPLRGD